MRHLVLLALFVDTAVFAGLAWRSGSAMHLTLCCLNLAAYLAAMLQREKRRA